MHFLPTVQTAELNELRWIPKCLYVDFMLRISVYWAISGNQAYRT